MSKMSKTIAILGVVAGLGVAALPLSSYAATSSTDGTPVSDTATVKLTIDKKLSIALDKKEADLTDGTTTDDIAVTVITNNTKGYSLKIAGTAGTNPTSLTGNNANTDQIVAFSKGADAPAALAVEGNASVWGYTVAGDDKVDGFTATTLFAGVKGAADADTIASSDAETAAAGNVTTVTFAAALVNNQPAGTYTGEVTFTASDNA